MNIKSYIELMPIFAHFLGGSCFGRNRCYSAVSHQTKLLSFKDFSHYKNNKNVMENMKERAMS